MTYEDILGSVRQLSYASPVNGTATTWADGSLTGNFTVTDGWGISTAYSAPTNTTPKTEIMYQIFNDTIQPLNAVIENKTNTNSILDKETWVPSK